MGFRECLGALIICIGFEKDVHPQMTNTHEMSMNVSHAWGSCLLWFVDLVCFLVSWGQTPTLTHLLLLSDILNEAASLCPFMVNIIPYTNRYLPRRWHLSIMVYVCKNLFVFTRWKSKKLKKKKKSKKVQGKYQMRLENLH